MTSFDLKDHELTAKEVYRNLPPSALYEHAIRYEKDASIAVQRDPTFGFDVVSECPQVPSEILIPRAAWTDGKAYDATAKRLAELFSGNFKSYEGDVGAEVKAAGP